jgi:transcriptional regulator with XRE-family HTH domain
MILEHITPARGRLHNANVHQSYNLPDPRKIIRELRKARGFASDRALAIAAAINQPTLSRYLANPNATMELDKFQALAETLEVSVSELLGEVPISSGGRLRELTRIMRQLPEAQQLALIEAGKALATANQKQTPQPRGA